MVNYSGQERAAVERERVLFKRISLPPESLSKIQNKIKSNYYKIQKIVLNPKDNIVQEGDQFRTLLDNFH